MNFDEWKASLVDGKNPCIKCIEKGNDRDGDNFHYYGEGRGGWCFSCGFKLLSDEYKEALQEEYEQNNPMEYEYMSGEFNDKIHEEIKANTGIDSKDYRGIRTDISKTLGVRYEYSTEDGSVVKTFYPVTKRCLEKSIKESLSGYKVREHPKDFYSVGEVGKDCDMFMQWKFTTHKGILLIVGGEVDSMSAYQMLYDHHIRSGNSKKYDEIAVVSSTIGEGGTAKQLRQHYQWLTQFNRIVIALDNDEAGHKATEDVVKVLPKGKAFVMPLRLKDANEYLEKGMEKEFINDFWAAKPYVPVGIKGSATLFEDVLQAAQTEKIPLPPFMSNLQDLMAGGIPLGVILNLGSASGQGKSTFVEELVYYWIFNSPYKVGVLSLESDSGEYGTKILSRHLGRKINLISDPDEKLDYLNSDFVKDKAHTLFVKPDGTNRFYLMDERGGTVKNIQESVERMIKECQVKIVVCDPLQDVIASLSQEEQEKFMDWQKSLVKSDKVTIININHVRKSNSGKEANSKGADISEEDFHGSSSIFKSAACNLLFTRNKESEDWIVRNTTHMKMTKCRWTGNTSPVAGKYFYDNQTHTLYDFDDWASQHPEYFPTES